MSKIKSAFGESSTGDITLAYMKGERTIKVNRTRDYKGCKSPELKRLERAIMEANIQ